MGEVRTSTFRFLGPTRKPTTLPTRGCEGWSLIIYNKYVCESAFAEKRRSFPKDRTRLMQDERRGIPLIYHRATVIPMKIFSTFTTKYVENATAENVKLAFSILCVFLTLFSMKIFSTKHHLTYFQA